MKRQIWTQKEDQTLLDFLNLEENQNIIQKGWSAISNFLKDRVPLWTRDAKQCRERWVNHLNPQLNVLKKQAFTWDIQLFLNSFSLNGKKWSIIKKQFPGRSENDVKNFFYKSIKKGLKNLNRYNRQVRDKKIYRQFRTETMNKVLKASEHKRQEDLVIFDETVGLLSKEITKMLMYSSQHQKITCQHSEFYERLHCLLIDFGNKCRFKKMKGKEKKEKKKDRVFTIFLKKEGQDVNNEEKNDHLATQSNNDSPAKKSQDIPKTKKNIGSINKDPTIFFIQNHKQITLQDARLFDVLF